MVVCSLVVGGMFLSSAQHFLLVGAYREIQPNPSVKLRQRQEDRNPFTSYIHYAYANMNSLVIRSELNVSQCDLVSENRRFASRRVTSKEKNLWKHLGGSVSEVSAS